MMNGAEWVEWGGVGSGLQEFKLILTGTAMGNHDALHLKAKPSKIAILWVR